MVSKFPKFNEKYTFTDSRNLAIPKEDKLKRTTLRHIIVKLLKTSDKENRQRTKRTNKNKPDY